MAEKILTVKQLHDLGKENLRNRGEEWSYPGGEYGPSVLYNRKLLDSLFFETKWFDPPEVDTGLSLFGRQFKTPVFCSAISTGKQPKMTTEIAHAIAKAGSFMMLGIGGNKELQEAIDTGAPIVKIIKPYRNTDLIFEKLHEAESRGCMAVGMDIDHFHGLQRPDGDVVRTELMGPQKTETIRQLISQTKLPFIIKGVLSLTDAQKAVDIGAKAIVVSNHASGSLTFSVPSLIALPKIAEKFGDKLTILVDTGFQTGNDVLKGLSLGARAVGMGSGMVLAWAAKGTEGVEMLIERITGELRRTMAATGCAALPDVDQSILVQTR